MPKPVKAETPEEVEITTPEIETPQPATEVELDASTGKPVVASKPAETSSAEEIRKMQARFEYRERQAERRERELMERIEKLSVPQPVISPAEKPSEEEVYGLKKDYLNQIGQTDWTQPVKLMAEKIAEQIAEKKFKEFSEAQEKQRQEQVKLQTTAQILEREKNWVLEQEPSLNDESSEEFRGFYATYNEMMKEDPTLIQNPRAPRLVYREWKSKVPTPAPVVIDQEKERLKRVAGGVAPQGRPTPVQKTIRLTQEEVDFCTEKGISPAVYAKMKDANFKEGVTA